MVRLVIRLLGVHGGGEGDNGELTGTAAVAEEDNEGASAVW